MLYIFTITYVCIPQTNGAGKGAASIGTAGKGGAAVFVKVYVCVCVCARADDAVGWYVYRCIHSRLTRHGVCIDVYTVGWQGTVCV